MPLRATVALDALLTIVNWPVYVPAVAGSNCTSSVSDCPGVSVAGNDAPDTENPVPLKLADFTVTAAVPVEVSVKGWDAGSFNGMLPKLIDVAFTPNPAVPAAGETVMQKLVDTPPAFAVMVATCVVVTALTVALKPVVSALALTVTSLGTFTAELLLVRLTSTLLDVFAERYTEHASVPAVLKVLLPHDTRLGTGDADAAAAPASNVRNDSVYAK